ncbi:sensor histidine kinase [Microbacterium sp. KUDC0406]|uniref:sensor histidine kinase n=1 Tax=Microbacterium sp. KUDC0406 TaxID=2909588 RepID=UPI001F458F3F|nr:sensor histidine kinase [Microbacterium sp. KUDC0406]UJP10378.1 sensor histidine kinase [Microbacterium sp. KUDC0406]
MTAAASVPSRHRMLRTARFALHLIAVLLTVVTSIRAVLGGVPLLPATLAAGLFLGWYGAGAALIHGRSARWWLAALTAIWAGMLVLSPEYTWLSFPLLLLAGHLLRGGVTWVYAAVVLAAAITAPMLHHTPLMFAHIVGPLLGGGFALAISLGYDTLLRDAAERERLIASLLQAQHETAALQDELAHTQREAGAAKERTRLARDLHDTIAQELSSVSLLARTGAAERMPQIDALAQQSLVELRRIVASLAPTELEDSALAGALERMLDTLRTDAGIDTALQVSEPMPALPTGVEVAFLRVAQSALANVRQHSGAARVEIHLSASEGVARLEIADDGHGFDEASAGRPGSSYGLIAMRSRLEELGGELRIDSTHGAGTRLTASVPLTYDRTVGDTGDSARADARTTAQDPEVRSVFDRAVESAAEPGRADAESTARGKKRGRREHPHPPRGRPSDRACRTACGDREPGLRSRR